MTTTATAKASADAALGVVRAVIEVAASPERVFHALTDPKELEAWWGAPDQYQTFDWESDLRPGGKRRCKARTTASTELSEVDGEYLAVDPPRLLEFTWRANWEGYVETRVRCELDAVPGGTRVTVVHSGFGGREKAAASYGDGWVRVLGWLGRHFVTA